jgi:hypothetical protein
MNKNMRIEEASSSKLLQEADDDDDDDDEDEDEDEEDCRTATSELGSDISTVRYGE